MGFYMGHSLLIVRVLGSPHFIDRHCIILCFLFPRINKCDGMSCHDATTTDFLYTLSMLREYKKRFTACMRCTRIWLWLSRVQRIVVRCRWCGRFIPSKLQNNRKTNVITVLPTTPHIFNLTRLYIGKCCYYYKLYCTYSGRFFFLFAFWKSFQFDFASLSCWAVMLQIVL